MKICILGNSHVAALKLAWEAMPEQHEDTSLTFFADRRRGLSDLVVSGDKLVPAKSRLKGSLEFTSGGVGLVDPQEYDLFLVYGLRAKGPFIDPAFNYTRALLELAAEDHVVGTLSYDIISRLRSITDKPIFVGHDPLPAYRGERQRSAPPVKYETGLRVVNEFAYSRVDAKLLSQPKHTIVNTRFTAPEFSIGSERLAVGDERDGEVREEGESRHMNAAFGEAWLASFFDEVRSPSMSS